jgi:leader peptidase (prepilin peptidase)/N-methyltransferase
VAYLNDILIFIFGVIAGSFLNVIIWRYNTGWSAAKGRSCCLVCAHTLKWPELVPIASFLLQGGQCVHCHSKISWQYPLVEFLSGLLFLGVYYLALPPVLTVVYWLAVSLLLAIAVYDYRHKIIPEGLVWLVVALGLLRAFLMGDVWPAMAMGVGGAVFFAALWAWSRGRWLGFGDAKLALAIGLLLGWPGGLTALVWAFWLGAIIGVLLIGLSKFINWRSGGLSFTIKSELPFAPFMVIGAVLHLIFNVRLPFF